MGTMKYNFEVSIEVSTMEDGYPTITKFEGKFHKRRMSYTGMIRPFMAKGILVINGDGLSFDSSLPPVLEEGMETISDEARARDAEYQKKLAKKTASYTQPSV